MLAGLRLVEGLRRSGKCHAVLDQYLRFVDMSHGNIGEIQRAHGALVEGDMVGIAAVAQKDVDSAVVRHLQMIQAVLRNIRGMVGEAIDLRVDLLEIDASQFLIH